MDAATADEGPTDASLLLEISALAREFALELLGDEAISEDIACDVMMECMGRMRAGTWHVKKSLYMLIRAMARGRGFDWLRAKRRRRAREKEFTRYVSTSVHIWMSPDLMLEHAELERFHERTLASLPHNCRRAYVMVREERERYQAVADRLGITRPTVNSHVVAAQNRFRESLRQEGIAAPPPAGRGTNGANSGRRRGDDAHQRDAGAHQRDGRAQQSDAATDRTDRSAKRHERRPRRHNRPRERADRAVPPTQRPLPPTNHKPAPPERSTVTGTHSTLTGAPRTGPRRPSAERDEPLRAVAEPAARYSETTIGTGASADTSRETRTATAAATSAP